MRKEFKLTEAQFEEIMVASQAVPYMVFGGVEPMSPQESANRAWEKLGKELGFEFMTVRPGSDDHHFTAETTGG